MQRYCVTWLENYLIRDQKGKKSTYNTAGSHPIIDVATEMDIFPEGNATRATMLLVAIMETNSMSSFSLTGTIQPSMIHELLDFANTELTDDMWNAKGYQFLALAMNRDRNRHRWKDLRDLDLTEYDENLRPAILGGMLRLNDRSFHTTNYDIA